MGEFLFIKTPTTCPLSTRFLPLPPKTRLSQRGQYNKVPSTTLSLGSRLLSSYNPFTNTVDFWSNLASVERIHLLDTRLDTLVLGSSHDTLHRSQ